MALRKLTNAAYLATNWQDEVESKNDLKKGLFIIDLDPVAKQIKSGSIMEANGIIYKSDTTTSPTNSPAVENFYYLYFRDISGTLDFYYSSEVPIFNKIKNGWYGSINSTWRAIANLYLTSTIWTSIKYLDKYDKDEVYSTSFLSSIVSTGTSVSPQKLIIPETSNIKIQSSGDYIIPSTGDYEIYISSNIQGSVTSEQTIVLKKNSSDTILKTEGSVFSTGIRPFNISGILNCTSGDILSLYHFNSTDTATLFNTCVIIKKIDKLSYSMIYNTSLVVSLSTALQKYLLPIDQTSINSNFTISSGRMTVKESGYYLLNFSSSWAVNNTSNFTFYVHKNAGVIVDCTNAGSTTVKRSILINKIVYLNKNDYVEIYLSSSAPSSSITLSNTFFSSILLQSEFEENISLLNYSKTVSTFTSGTSITPVLVDINIKESCVGFIYDQGKFICILSGKYKISLYSNLIHGTTSTNNIFIIKKNNIEIVSDTMAISSTAYRNQQFYKEISLNSGDDISILQYTIDAGNISLNTTQLCIEKIN